MKESLIKSVIANVVVLAGTVLGSLTLGIDSENGIAVFWFLLIIQVLANELWLYVAAVPALFAALFSKKQSEERSVMLVLRIMSFVLVVGPLALYTVLYLLRPLIGEWFLAELGVPLSGTMMLTSLLGQMVLFVLVWIAGLVPVCPSAAFNMLDNDNK